MLCRVCMFLCCAVHIIHGKQYCAHGYIFIQMFILDMNYTELVVCVAVGIWH